MGRSGHSLNKITSAILLISAFVLFFFFSGSDSLVQTGYYTEQVQKSLNSFLRKIPSPESYEEETVDRPFSEFADFM